MSQIRVMIIEDSSVVRQLLEAVIETDPRLRVVGAFATAEEGLQRLDALAPDVISMDIRLPGMDGFQATRRIMAERPTPIVVVSASVETSDLNITMNALNAGALTVLDKPAGESRESFDQLSDRLCTQLVIMSQVRLIRRTGRGGRGAAVAPTPPASPPVARPTRGFAVLSLVASTGGPRALSHVLAALPADLPVPILVVQHITPTFLEGFVRWLGQVCSLPVLVARHGVVPVAGSVYVAPADRHLTYDGQSLVLKASDPVSGQRPSGTVLFDSLATHLRERALGVLLTGMGDDGARGLAAIRAAGGYTLAESAETAVVYGMPAVAASLGAVCEQLPLPQIPGRLVALTRVAPSLPPVKARLA